MFVTLFGESTANLKCYICTCSSMPNVEDFEESSAWGIAHGGTRLLIKLYPPDMSPRLFFLLQVKQKSPWWDSSPHFSPKILCLRIPCYVRTFVKNILCLWLSLLKTNSQNRVHDVKNLCCSPLPLPIARKRTRGNLDQYHHWNSKISPMLLSELLSSAP